MYGNPGWQQASEPRPSWWKRNWKWVVPVGCLTPLCLCSGFIAFIGLVVFGSIKSSDPYRDSLAAVRADARVREKLGTPIEDGWMPSGSIEKSGSGGHADIRYDVSGPRGEGSVHAVAERNDGRWTFTTIDVEIKSTGETISVMGARGADPTTPTTPTQAAAPMPQPPASCATARPRPRPAQESAAMQILASLSRESSNAEVTQGLARVDALLAQNPNDADAHYARGVLMSQLQQPPEPILAEYERAMALDPQHADAAYNAGVVRARTGNEVGALEYFERATRIDPAFGDAYYNAGQAAYNLRRFEQSLSSFLCARVLSPDPFDETKKVVQALHALGRFGEAITARQEMWRIQSASRNPDVQQLREAVIDQLTLEGRRVMIYETVPPRTPPALRYLYIARAYENGNVVQQVQLETSAVIALLGTAAIIGYQQGTTHHTTGISFREMPTYEQVRPTLTDLLGRLLRGEPLPSGASSAPSP